MKEINFYIEIFHLDNFKNNYKTNVKFNFKENLVEFRLVDGNKDSFINEMDYFSGVFYKILNIFLWYIKKDIKKDILEYVIRGYDDVADMKNYYSKIIFSYNNLDDTIFNNNLITTFINEHNITNEQLKYSYFDDECKVKVELRELFLYYFFIKLTAPENFCNKNIGAHITDSQISKSSIEINNNINYIIKNENINN